MQKQRSAAEASEGKDGSGQEPSDKREGSDQKLEEEKVPLSSSGGAFRPDGETSAEANREAPEQPEKKTGVVLDKKPPRRDKAKNDVLSVMSKLNKSAAVKSKSLATSGATLLGFQNEEIIRLVNGALSLEDIGVSVEAEAFYLIWNVDEEKATALLSPPVEAAGDFKMTELDPPITLEEFQGLDSDFAASYSSLRDLRIMIPVLSDNVCLEVSKRTQEAPEDSGHAHEDRKWAVSDKISIDLFDL